jgi:hypothetical protein
MKIGIGLVVLAAAVLCCIRNVHPVLSVDFAGYRDGGPVFTVTNNTRYDLSFIVSDAPSISGGGIIDLFRLDPKSGQELVPRAMNGAIRPQAKRFYFRVFPTRLTIVRQWVEEVQMKVGIKPNHMTTIAVDVPPR